MRVEPEIDQQRLRDYLADSYGVKVRELAYVPQGEVAYNYIIRSESDHPSVGGHGEGQRYVLKLLDPSRLAGLAAARMQVAVPLLLEMRGRRLLTHVPQPVATCEGQPTGIFDDFTVVVLRHVEGSNPDDATLHRPDVWAQLAGLVARLHAATSSVRTRCPYLETYELPFERDLVMGMRTLARVLPGAREGIRDLQRLLLPYADTVAALLARTKNLALLARRLAPPQVLCHTDIHAMNLLIDDRDTLTLLDWEGVKLAPAEHDLFAFNGDDLPAFLEAYWRAGGVRQLNADVFGFYFYRRNLEDLTDWLVRILYENRSAVQDQVDLAGLRSDCIDGWPYLAPATEQIRRQLEMLIT
ncbi:MAG: aminoglycoside phosphotransferase family protein [Anaerolineae bacterium]|nr:aminoglycoside phosphotransferase family protein [Anaerolineae bacterium]